MCASRWPWASGSVRIWRANQACSSGSRSSRSRSLSVRKAIASRTVRSRSSSASTSLALICSATTPRRACRTRNAIGRRGLAWSLQLVLVVDWQRTKFVEHAGEPDAGRFAEAELYAAALDPVIAEQVELVGIADHPRRVGCSRSRGRVPADGSGPGPLYALGRGV